MRELERIKLGSMLRFCATWVLYFKPSYLRTYLFEKLAIVNKYR
jgi:hypothetical protein